MSDGPDDDHWSHYADDPTGGANEMSDETRCGTHAETNVGGLTRCRLQMGHDVDHDYDPAVTLAPYVYKRKLDTARSQLAATQAELDRARAALETARIRERADVLDEVSYRWERRNEVGKPFSEWLWEWVNQAREALASTPTPNGTPGVDPVERVLAVECPTCGMQAGRECFPDGGPKGDSLLCAARIRAAGPTKGRSE